MEVVHIIREHADVCAFLGGGEPSGFLSEELLDADCAAAFVEGARVSWSLLHRGWMGRNEEGIVFDTDLLEEASPEAKAAFVRGLAAGVDHPNLLSLRQGDVGYERLAALAVSAPGP